jgi:hypothetical protein
LNTKLKKLIGPFLLVLAAGPVSASEIGKNWSPQSQELLKSLISDMRETMSLIEIAEAKQGRTLEKFKYSLDLAGAYQINLGLILQLNSTESAFDILSVTPGSLASSHGLRVGDKIVMLNGIAVSAGTEAGMLKKIQQLQVDEEIILTLDHDGRNQEVVIPVSGKYVPRIKLEIGKEYAKASQTGPVAPDLTACGEVTVSLTPPVTGQLYPVSFYLDDERDNKQQLAVIKLPVGKHTVTVYAQADNGHVDGSHTDKSQAKAIEINVRANTSYHLGARFFSENKPESQNNAYWDAVIWKTSQRQCRLYPGEGE